MSTAGLFGPAGGALTLHGLRQALRGRRLFGLGIVVLAPAALALAIQAIDPGAAQDPAGLQPLLFVIGVGLVVPLLCLFLGTGVFRDELEQGTIVHLATRPVSRTTVALSRLAGAMLAALLLSALSLVLATAVIRGGSVDALVAALQVSALGVLAYTSLFAMLGALTKRAVIVGLLYVVAWENVVASTPLYFRFTTVAFWLRSIVANGQAASASVVNEMIQGTPATNGAALLAVLTVTVVATAAAVLWFRGKELAGPEEE